MKKSELFTYSVRCSIRLVPMEDMIYLENKMRKILLITVNGEDEFYGTFREVIEQLDDRFLYAGRTYILNGEHVRAMQYNGEYEVIMDNGRHLPMSKKSYDKMKKEMERYLRGEKRK